MFFLICASLLLSMRGSNAQVTDVSPVKWHCQEHMCIVLPEGEITAEPGSRVVIPCSLFNLQNPAHLFMDITWYKCDPGKRMCSDSEIVFPTDDFNVGQSRVLPLEPEIPGSCGIVINDVTASDSGWYRLRVGGFWRCHPEGLLVSVRDFGDRGTTLPLDPTQKPTVTVNRVADGEEATLTCTAPGDCPPSPDKIAWTIPASLTVYREKNTRNCISELIFNASKTLDGSKFTCKVSLLNNIITEETVTLEVLSAAQPGEQNSALLWIIIAVVSLAVNVVFIILLIILWNTRNKVKPNQEDRVYMSLDKPTISQYDVIARRTN